MNTFDLIPANDVCYITGGTTFEYGQESADSFDAKGQMDLLQVGDEMTFALDQDAPATQTVTVTVAATDISLGRGRIEFTPAWSGTAPGAGNGPFRVTSTRFTDGNIGGSQLPPNDGDILQWVDADQKFKPAKLPDAGISDAPSDGTPYVRQDGAWLSVTAVSGGTFGSG